jgi:hypothetical protein
LISLNSIALKQRQFGIRYYEAFSKKANVSQAIGDEDERLSKIYGRETTKNENIEISAFFLINR